VENFGERGYNEGFEMMYDNFEKEKNLLDLSNIGKEKDQKNETKNNAEMERKKIEKEKMLDNFQKNKQFKELINREYKVCF
jgi:hypothetical protein